MEGNRELRLVGKGPIIRRGSGLVAFTVPAIHMAGPDRWSKVHVARPLTSVPDTMDGSRGDVEDSGEHASKVVANGHHASVAQWAREDRSRVLESSELLTVGEGRTEDRWLALEDVHEDL